ncbi:MAG: O-acetyl-ADP-ribose deacetylase [Acidobacteriaceae bacterium]|nr:O-acetyl-ADP-ribose deacetylase [Acidobacteriota bacterium]MBV8808680.1 O-acetyl-ADP-ribose deacetylase [Acidobacteriaceae bacterium]MBV9498871.1 O-acetyl-ADP-ribose deacetylase [Acidobacteriaceae bacterium]
MSSDFVIHLGLSQLQLLKGDITKIAVDAIVNAANSSLAGGGGVDGAIHRAGGPQIMLELDEIRKQIGQCETGSAVVTSAGRLPARYVFHAVGPRYRDGQHDEPAQLASCYTKCLDMAAERELATISFPSISTGIYGYPIEEAADIAVRTVTEWLREHTSSVRIVKLVQFSASDHEVYQRHAQDLRASAAPRS